MGGSRMTLVENKFVIDRGEIYLSACGISVQRIH